MSVVDLKTKEEKDAELDRRIEALRKKNEALMKRHQEIEADKKRAEQEGIAVTTPRKPRPHEPIDSERRKNEKENITVTVDLSKSSGEARMVNDRKSASNHGPEERDGSHPYDKSPPRRPGSGRMNRGGQRGGIYRSERREPQEGEGEGPARNERYRGRGRGGRGTTQPSSINSDRKSKEWEEKRRQNIEKMNEEMEKIAEYERGKRNDGEKNPIRNFLDDPRRSGPFPEVDRKEGSRRHVRNWGGLDFENVKMGAEGEREWTNRRPGGRGSFDMTMSMTGRERAEYLRWKKEREQIDEERLARHRNATGQWKREWDAQKNEKMFNEDTAVSAEGTTEPSSRREDSRRPPKAPTFGDFVGQNKPREVSRGGRGKGKGHSQGKSYSMHDNRWEGEKDEETTNKEQKNKEKIKKESKTDGPSEKKQTFGGAKKTGTAEEDDDEWEDTGEEEEVEIVEDEYNKEGSLTKSLEKSHTPPVPSTPSPKDQRPSRPKVKIPSPPTDNTLKTPEGTKPSSPFYPLEEHHPVTDWGEEMEMLSPKSSLGESPLRPSSSDSSPAQIKNQEEECVKDKIKPPELLDIQPETQPDSTDCEALKDSSSAEPVDSNISQHEENTASLEIKNEKSEAPAVEQVQQISETEPAVDVPATHSDQPSSG